MSEGVEWAAHCATVLAGLPEGAALSAATLAQFHGVPRPYLAKALQSLSRAGLVTSTQGRGGGYRLARRADKVTLLDVVQAVEGREPAFQCTEIRQNAPYPAPARCFRSTCGITVAMRVAEKAWRDSLAGTTIAALADGVIETVPAASREANAGWLAERAGRAGS